MTDNVVEITKNIESRLLPKPYSADYLKAVIANLWGMGNTSGECLQQRSKAYGFAEVVEHFELLPEFEKLLRSKLDGIKSKCFSDEVFSQYQSLDETSTVPLSRVDPTDGQPVDTTLGEYGLSLFIDTYTRSRPAATAVVTYFRALGEEELETIFSTMVSEVIIEFSALAGPRIHELSART